jgi:hypothetical protein
MKGASIGAPSSLQERIFARNTGPISLRKPLKLHALVCATVLCCRPKPSGHTHEKALRPKSPLGLALLSALQFIGVGSKGKNTFSLHNNCIEKRHGPG